MHLEFDSTLDEIVDANIRLAEQTNAYRQERRKAQWAVAAVYTIASMVAVFRGLSHVTPIAAGIALGFAIASGVVGYVVYGRFHDWYARRNCRRMVRELYRGGDRVGCAFEVRQDALWTKVKDIETSFPWASLTRVNDASDSIELWFNPGLAVVRNRAFRSPDERRLFLDQTRSFVAIGSST